MKSIAAMILCALAVLPIAGVAFAHTFLDAASPGAGAHIEAPPAKLVLSFTEPIGGADVGVQVFDAAGALVASSMDAKTAIDGATITLALPKLKPGAYRVAWQVDYGGGHRTEGDYRFTMLGPGP